MIISTKRQQYDNIMNNNCSEMLLAMKTRNQ